jgi:hypothetical protein
MQSIEATERHKEINNRIRKLMEQRFQKLGPIKPGDAWEICRNEFSYELVRFHFKIIMQQKRKEGKADFIRNGLWFIHKNNINEKEKRF